MTDNFAVVTGAGGDIGLAIARKLAAAGYALALVDIDAEACRAAKADIEPTGATVLDVNCDVTDPGAVADMAVRLLAQGPVGLIINNAGGITASSLQSTSLEDWREDLSLNLEAAFLVFKAFEASLMQTAGAVVNIASVNATGVYGHPGYSAAKAGLVQFTRFLAVEYGKYGIRANAVAPGSVATRAWQARALQNPDVLEDARRWYPLQRIATPADVANVVGFLASPEASAITGVCLPVDCGLSAGSSAMAATFSQSADFYS